MNSFKKDFDAVCAESMGTLGRQMLKDDPKQAELVAKRKALREALIEKLNGDGKPVDAYDEAINAEAFWPELYIYQQGFQDSVYLLRWMGLLEGLPGREQMGRGCSL